MELLCIRWYSVGHYSALLNVERVQEDSAEPTLKNFYDNTCLYILKELCTYPVFLTV